MARRGAISKGEQKANTPAQLFAGFPAMASPLINAVDPAFSGTLAAKRADILQHMARSERLVSVCPASRLEVRPRPEMLSSGVMELDTLAGGIPRGCISEFYGGASSGKSSALLAALAHVTRRDESCVLIDASDSFDPKSADAAGVNFNRLLWVRCGGRKVRCDTNEDSLQNRRAKIGTRSKQRIFRQPADDPLGSEFRLEQVLKTTDLILQSGGFGLVVLDLAGIPEKFVRRIPLASWFRFQRAVEHTKTALLVISEFPCAQTCAALVTRIGKQLSAISDQPSEHPPHSELLTETQVNAELMRSRLERKPMQSVTAEFTTQAVRAG